MRTAALALALALALAAPAAASPRPDPAPGPRSSIKTVWDVHRYGAPSCWTLTFTDGGGEYGLVCTSVKRHNRAIRTR